ncbi:MAG: gluconeogenesis factor YvcK family protein [bacterium]
MVKGFRWLYPGLKVKRWIFILLLGVVLFGFALFETLDRMGFFSGGKISWIYLIAMGIGGIALVAMGILEMGRSIFTIGASRRRSSDDPVASFQKHLQLSKGPKVVAIGGGTGLSVLLHGLKEYTRNISAIVTVSDDGGSSGRLRQDFNILPPGDIRNCLVALADAEDLMSKLFQYRFDRQDGLSGHSFGNLFITAMTEVSGSFEKAIEQSSRVLEIRGSVIPSTLRNVRLGAEFVDGDIVIGESNIPQANKRIKRVFLVPPDCPATPAAIEAINEADAIILGPGSLYTSIIPNLLVGGMVEAISGSRAKKIYICNVMTQSGETDDYTVSQHVSAIVAHGGRDIIDCVIANNGDVPLPMLRRYSKSNQFEVELDEEEVVKLGVRVIKDSLISADNFIRHDAVRLAELVMSLIYGRSPEGRAKVAS